MPDPSRAGDSPGGYAPPPLDSYRFFSDRVMGGVSTGAARVTGSEGARHLALTGSVSTENRGGFIQARADIDASFPAEARGVVIRVRGNGQRYFVHLRTRGTILPWQYYQAGFETTPAWREVRLPFVDFASSGAFLRDTPRPETVTSLAVVAYGRDHEADVAFQWIGLY
ncbi:CIA30 family protein [Roseovarius ramblicola]|uniref:CIA30 family protein n=1 Tax=Roseovarius ramblicola TaxID=2022336 RepID=A0ABV5HZL2_9RHOB